MRVTIDDFAYSTRGTIQNTNCSSYYGRAKHSCPVMTTVLKMVTMMVLLVLMLLLLLLVMVMQMLMMVTYRCDATSARIRSPLTAAIGVVEQGILMRLRIGMQIIVNF